MSTSPRQGLAAILAALLSLLALVGTAGPATAAGAVETMPLWRLQVRITTGDTATAGTTGTPMFRFNDSSTGVRTLNPPTMAAFGRSRVATYDLRLFDTASQMTMLRVGVNSTDDWCIRKTELLFNGRVAFAQDAVPGGGGACVSIKGGTYLTYPSAALRTNAAWTQYGTPPALPQSMSASTMLAMTTSVTGSALLSIPGLRWDTAKPLAVVRKSSTSFGVSFGVRVNDPNGVEPSNSAFITYDIRLYLGADGNLHARKFNELGSYPTVGDTAVTQLDKALSRMSVRPNAHLTLTFTIDTAKNILWS